MQLHGEIPWKSQWGCFGHKQRVALDSCLVRSVPPAIASLDQEINEN